MSVSVQGGHKNRGVTDFAVNRQKSSSSRLRVDSLNLMSVRACASSSWFPYLIHKDKLHTLNSGCRSLTLTARRYMDLGEHTGNWEASSLFSL